MTSRPEKDDTVCYNYRPISLMNRNKKFKYKLLNRIQQHIFTLYCRKKKLLGELDVKSAPGPMITKVCSKVKTQKQQTLPASSNVPHLLHGDTHYSKPLFGGK